MQATIVFNSNFSKQTWQRIGNDGQVAFTQALGHDLRCGAVSFYRSTSWAVSGGVQRLLALLAAEQRPVESRGAAWMATGTVQRMARPGVPKALNQAAGQSACARRSGFILPVTLNTLQARGFNAFEQLCSQKWLVSRTLSSNLDLYRITKRRQPGSATASWLSYAMFKQSCCRW